MPNGPVRRTAAYVLATHSSLLEIVTLDDPQLGLLLKCVCRGLARGDRSSEMSPGQYREAFRAAVELLGLGNMQMLPYSLRRGGATFDFRLHGAMDRCVLRGALRSLTAEECE